MRFVAGRGPGTLASTRPAACAGFTLIELAVVLAIIAVVTAVSVPALRLPENDVPSPEGAVREVVRSARAEALRRGETMELIIDLTSDRYWLFSDKTREVASGRFGFGGAARWAHAEPRLVLRLTRAGAIDADGPLNLRHADGRVESMTWSRWSGRPGAGGAQHTSGGGVERTSGDGA